jgi:uncharacterized membrane protein (UPF0127 family)
MNKLADRILDRMEELDGESSSEAIVSIGRVKISCELANTVEKQTLGLQKRASLAAGDGMLFVFDKPKRAMFHMASVSFPIDMVFINAQNRISKIVPNIDPGTKGTWSMPHTAHVLEVNGDFCFNNGIGVGDLVDISNIKTAQEKYTVRTDVDRKQQNQNRTKERYEDPLHLTEERAVTAPKYDQGGGFSAVDLHDKDEVILPDGSKLDEDAPAPVRMGRQVLATMAGLLARNSK